MLAPQEVDSDATRLTTARLISTQVSVAGIFYLGGCDGAGLGVGAEWGGLPCAFLDRGASSVVGHSWAVIDSPEAASVDRDVVSALQSNSVPAAIAGVQRSYLREWRNGGGVSPHWWSGLQVFGHLV